MQIREATLKDVPTLLRLWEDFMGYLDGIVKKNSKLKPYLVKKKGSSGIFGKFIRKNIRSKNSVVYIAEVGGNPAGYSLIYVKDDVPIFRLEKIGYIGDLFVKKEFRGQKISSGFRDEAMRWFKKKGIRHVSLAVYKDNEFAHSIYRKWGFFDYHVEMRRKI